ncbi:hypothetical protein CF15_05990 [Pyrodictium occultum]|uniref:Dehydrogenase n=1 Tax=Pyrodictium occultum TaxID=2309 RepID=A0A0V8RW51_PYROC|nr:hypothetical protein CF15_05990 [Pyrodictium occultum]
MAVVGAGVAGSVLATLLQAKGISTVVYDITPSYRKPCGEAVPAGLLDQDWPEAVEKPRILNVIKRFIFMVDAEVVRVYESKRPVWYTIDKSRWIDGLRSRLNVVSKPVDPESLLDSHSLVADARGPFSSKGVKIPVWRAYADNPGIDGESVYLIFLPGRLGLAWVFPHGHMLNIGGGFMDVKNPREVSVKLVSKALGQLPKLRGEAYSLVTVFPRIELLTRSGVVKTGEAAGLVMSLGGEGIRPAVLSARALADAVSLDDDGRPFLDARRYREGVRSLSIESRTHSLMLLAASALGKMGVERILSKAPEDLIKTWLEGRLRGPHYLVKGITALL